MTTRVTKYDTATSKAPTPDDEALWCKPCAAETWHRMEPFPVGNIEIGRMVVTYARAISHCRNCDGNVVPFPTRGRAA